GEFGKRLARGTAEKGSIPCQAVVGGVAQLEDVIPAAKHELADRRLHEDGLQLAARLLRFSVGSGLLARLANLLYEPAPFQPALDGQLQLLDIAGLGQEIRDSLMERVDGRLR